ncbi:hypothetical protein Drorol1_Dr00005735 [Drosera rotundifolia]
MRTLDSPMAASPPQPPPPSTTAQTTTWQSPIPYLFGGLAAMLGLVAFSLLVLAFSYYKLSGYLDNTVVEYNDDFDVETAEECEKKKGTMMVEGSVLVVMAGKQKPTHVATPVGQRERSHEGEDHNH